MKGVGQRTKPYLRAVNKSIVRAACEQRKQRQSLSSKEVLFQKENYTKCSVFINTLPGFEIVFFIQTIKILTSKQQKITNILAAAFQSIQKSLNKNNEETAQLSKITSPFGPRVQDKCETYETEIFIWPLKYFQQMFR